MVLLLFRSNTKYRYAKFSKIWHIFPILYSSIFLFVLPPLSAQQLSTPLKEISIGYPITQESLPEKYTYNPLFLTARFPLGSPKERFVSFYIEPQLAYTFPPTGIKSAIEFGSNLGIQYAFWRGKKHRLAAALGVGPHYTSLVTTMQHKGFLFSDNIELGYYQLLTDQIGMQLKCRFRHLSNANLQQPNKGLDNLFLMVGICWKNPE